MPILARFVLALSSMLVLGSALPGPSAAGTEGDPWLRVRELRALETGRAAAPARGEARALASGDLDEDGVPDLVVGYATAAGGAIVVHRGFLGAVYPNDPSARRMVAEGRADPTSPFLPDAERFETPEAADFVAVGDFDADGHPDVALAARGRSALHLLRGDGKAALAAAEKIALTGFVTAFASGDLNRRDGLEDLAVAVEGGEGDALLVYESPQGALRAAPERVSLPGRATDLAVGHLDDDGHADVAALTGSRITLIHGRDRQLALDATARRAVPAARTESLAAAAAPLSIAIGEFEGGYGTAPELAALLPGGDVQILSRDGHPARFAGTRRIASGARGVTAGRRLVAARVSSFPLDEALVIDAGAGALRVVEAASDARAAERGAQRARSLATGAVPIAVLPMRLTKHALTSLVVARAGDPAPAVLEVTANGVFTVTSPASTPDANLGDGLCADLNDACTLRAADEQSNASAGLQEIDFDLPSQSTTIVYGPRFSDIVSVDGTTQPGFAGAPLVEVTLGCNCPLMELGGSASTSTIRGLVLNGAASHGIVFNPASQCVIEGNYVGTNRSGTAASGPLGNGVNVIIGAGNLIGGTVAAARNVISGGTEHGIVANPGGQIVRGNYIGLDAAGLVAVPNALDGIHGNDSQMIIGGTAAGAGNVIAGNAAAPSSVANVALGDIDGNPDPLLIQGNLIGTDRTGTVKLAAGGPASGIRIAGTSGATIGGTSPTARNVIAGHPVRGISLESATAFLVQGNLVGLGLDGGSTLGNAADGIRVTGIPGNGAAIGGTAVGARNVIAFNGGAGICFTGLGTVRMQRNSVHSNQALGIELEGGAACDGTASVNDPGDDDPGANGRLNSPSITSVAGTSAAGTFATTPAAASYTLELFSSASCDASGKGEGRTYRGSTVLNTAPDGTGSFNAVLESGVPTGQALTAVAIDAAGNTSEFSGCTTAGGSTAFELDEPALPVQVGGEITLTGGGFTAGTVLKVFIGTANGPLDVIPDGLAPTAVTSTSWSATLPFPWPLGGPGATSLGEGFAALQMVRKDMGFDTSNTVPAMLLGNPGLAQPVPSITAINGIPLLKGIIAAPTTYADGVALDGPVTLTGTGFSNSVVNLYTAAGNLGPITPTSQNGTSIELELPDGTPAGPGSFQVVNTPSFLTSNAAVVQLREPVQVFLVTIVEGTSTVVGTGLSSLTVLQFFVSGVIVPESGPILPYFAKFGGLDANGAPIIPLQIIDSQHATFPTSVLAFPPGTIIAAGFAEAINPPYLGEASRGAVIVLF